jgi:hypothetical protein
MKSRRTGPIRFTRARDLLGSMKRGAVTAVPDAGGGNCGALGYQILTRFSGAT